MLKLDNYQKLFYTYFFRSISTIFPVITLFYLSRGATIFQIFLLSVIYSIVTIFFEIPTGIIGDKLGRKASIIFGGCFMILHIILFIFAQSFFVLALAFSSFVIAVTFFSGSVEAFIYDSLKDEGKEQKMNQYYAKYLSAANLSGIVIPFFVGFIAKDLTDGQFLTLLYITLVTQIISLFFALLLKEPKHHKKRKKTSIQLLRDSFVLLKGKRDLMDLGLNKGLVIILFVAYWRIWQPYFNETILVPVFLFGILISMNNGLLYLLKQKYDYLEQKIGIINLIKWSAYIPILAGVVFLFTSNLYVHILIWFLIITPLQLRETFFSHYMNKKINSENRATTLSLISLLTNLLGIPFAILIGFIASKSLVYAIIPALIIAIVAVNLFGIKNKHTNIIRN
jgi:MFS family permease